MDKLDQIINSKKLVVICGSGGVGKTSLSSALGYYAAEKGKKTLVITIDPARRLMDALGINEPSLHPVKVPDINGKLYALMVYSRVIMDDFFKANLDSQDDLNTIFNNTLYNYITNEWPGMHEYAAMQVMAKHWNDWDLIILDTPPTKNAWDFFSAPQRLSAFLDKKIAKFFFNEATRFSLKLFTKTSNIAIKLFSKALGGGTLSDILDFFRCITPVIGEISKVSEKISYILKDDECSFLYVTTPTNTHLYESRMFLDLCEKSGYSIDLIIANRVWGFQTEEIPDILINEEKILKDKNSKLIPKALNQIIGLIKNENEVLTKLSLLAHPLELGIISQKNNLNLHNIFNSMIRLEFEV